MRFGSGIILIVLGAILVFALNNVENQFVDFRIIGYILMAAGVVGIIWALLASQRTRRTESRTVRDPNTGETIQQSESHDGI